MRVTHQEDGSLILERSEPVKENCACAYVLQMEQGTGKAYIAETYNCVRAPKCGFPYWEALKIAQLIFDAEETVEASL